MSCYIFSSTKLKDLLFVALKDTRVESLTI